MESASSHPMVELHNDMQISKGASRRCYRHPTDPGKCIKVYRASSKNALDGNEYELSVYADLKEKLNGFIVDYDAELIRTDQGPGLVCELLRDEDGSISGSLKTYRTRHAIGPDLRQQLDQFFELLFTEGLYFYDFNLKNFIVQKTSTGEHLKYIDIKGYQRAKSWIKTEHALPFMARQKMKRRMKKLYRQADLS